MHSTLTFASVTITLALIFYSLGVWSERSAHFLKRWHVACFWTGLFFDVTGTWAMHLISKNLFNITDPHTLTGQIALWLMFFHAVWATWTILKGSDKLKTAFHRYSIIVWLIWLVPYFGGMYLAMNK